VAVIGVPMDLGVTNRAGARLGPAPCARSSGSVRTSMRSHRAAPLVVPPDVGDVPMQSRFSLEQCHADIEAYFTDVCAKG
jgi:agmatinase